ncbi:hypothetical protein LUZ60_000443 [Juncus effusus]|nr:hypothetical protein LUZ60_000443 [Juncus effusus]
MATPLFLFFFFTLLLSLSNGVSSLKPTYQTLVLTPLQEPITPNSPFFDSESLTTTTTPSNALHIPISHVDSLSLPSNSTAEGLFLSRLKRDNNRAEWLFSSLSVSPRSNRSFATPVVSGLSQGSGEYFARIGVGTPQTRSLFVLDTGSDVLWLQCAPCRHCYTQSTPIFTPSKSRSFKSIPCNSPVCHRLDSPGCDTKPNKCLYEVSYGDGSVTSGEFGTETLSFGRRERVGRIGIGCGHDNEGLFVAASGLLGLGRGPLSFPSQLSRRYGRKFSYCLVDRTASPNPKISSIIFGESSMPLKTVFTPMVQNPKMSTFYYVELTGVSVGGTRVSGLAESDLKLDPQTGRGGVILDSGTSVTRLARSAYSSVRDAFRAGTAGLKRTAGGFSLFDTCYDLNGQSQVKVPTVSLHFNGNADVVLPPENYLIPVDMKGTFCFAFSGTDGGVSIIGNIQQQGFRVVFDSDRNRVGFVPKGC